MDMQELDRTTKILTFLIMFFFWAFATVITSAIIFGIILGLTWGLTYLAWFRDININEYAYLTISIIVSVSIGGFISYHITKARLKIRHW